MHTLTNSWMNYLTDQINAAAEALAVYLIDVLEKYAPMMGVEEHLVYDLKLAALDEAKEQLK